MEKRSKLNQISIILLGSLILAFGVFNFNYQNNITEGGVLGMLLLLKNMFNIDPSISSLIIDLSLFAVGYKFFGREFLFKSLVATVSFAIFYAIFEKIGPIIPVLDSKLVGTVLAGLFVGVGVGLIVRTEAAAGGDDVIALVISKNTKLTIGNVYMISDIIILSLSLTYLSAYDIFWSLVAVNISGRIIDVMYNYNPKISVA